MTLSEIRQCESFVQLEPAIKFLCDKMHDMPYGEFIEMKRTIGSQSLKIGLTLQIINEYAENYQIFGYQPEKKV